MAAMVGHLEQVQGLPGQELFDLRVVQHHVPGAVATSLADALALPFGVGGEQQPPAAPFQQQHDAQIVLQPVILLGEGQRRVEHIVAEQPKIPLVEIAWLGRFSGLGGPGFLSR